MDASFLLFLDYYSFCTTVTTCLWIKRGFPILSEMLFLHLSSFSLYSGWNNFSFPVIWLWDIYIFFSVSYKTKHNNHSLLSEFKMEYILTANQWAVLAYIIQRGPTYLISLKESNLTTFFFFNYIFFCPWRKRQHHLLCLLKS